MNCPECGGKTRVVESRLREGCVWRRRKCKDGHLSYTQEVFVEKKAKPKTGRRRPPLEPFPPALREWNIVVTKASPLWLKSIAMQLG